MSIILRRDHRVALLLLAGCGYQPNSFERGTGTFPGVRDTIGCLDVAVYGRHDLMKSNPVVEYTFGNRCEHPVVVDLGSIRARGRSAAREFELVAVDPRMEIRPLPMDGRWTGREIIEYRPRDGEVDPILAVCLDLGSIDGTRGAGERWLCEPARDAVGEPRS